MHMANTIQWMSVLTTPIDVYLMNSFNIIKISEFLEDESLTSSMLMIDSCCIHYVNDFMMTLLLMGQKRDTQSFASVCKALCASGGRCGVAWMGQKISAR